MASMHRRTNGAISAGMLRQIPTAERKERVPAARTHTAQSPPRKTCETQTQQFRLAVYFMSNFVLQHL